MPKNTKKQIKQLATSFQDNQERSPATNFFEENWGILANLLVTIIVGVVVTVYLQNQQEIFEAAQQQREQQFQTKQQAQNEELQKQLIQLQNQTQFASIEITHKDFVEHRSTADTITVKNLGPSIAKNIRIVICINDIHVSWAEQIPDISHLQIAPANTAINFSQENITTNCRYDLGPDSTNATLINIEALPPNEDMSIDIGRPKDVLTWGYGTNTQASMIFINDQFSTEKLTQLEQDNLYIDSVLRKFMKEEFYVAKLIVEASCENCNVTNDDNSLTITGFAAMDGYNNSTIKINSVEKTPQYLILTTNISIIYTRPTDGQPIGDLKLFLQGFGDNLQFKQINEFEFNSVQPILTPKP